MWTTENRARHDRSKLRYPSDLTDAEWSLIEPLIPPAKRGGRRRQVDIREVLNGVMYILSTGCQWQYLPGDLPPKSTVYDYFNRWDCDGTLRKIHDTLYAKCREQAGRRPSPTAGVIDSQSVKSAEKGGACIDPNGYDAGKKIKGKKRHILVDTTGLLVGAVVHPADIQDRDGGVLVLASLFDRFPLLRKLFADAGYQGPKFRSGVTKLRPRLNVEIVKRSDAGFKVLPRRWVVERTLAWLGRCRRLAKDLECLTRNALAFLRWASVRFMLRKLCNPS